MIDGANAPLVVGVTGHRNLRDEDLPKLGETVRGVFRQLMANLELTPLMVLSPLAEGADRICARVALEVGAMLIVPLPMPIAEYRSDFGTVASQHEFDDLLNQASRVIVSAGSGFDRNSAYLASTIFVIRNCDVLIALWDHVETGGIGGTYHAVCYKSEGLPDEFVPGQTALDHVERGPVITISTPRISQPEPLKPAFHLDWRFPPDDPDIKERFEQNLKYLRDFNADVERQRTLRSKLIKNPSTTALPPEITRLEEIYRTVAGMAERYHRWRRWTLGISVFLAVVAIIAFETFDDLWHDPSLAFLYPLALLACLLIYAWSKRKDFHRRHLDYRALAEGLRVQIFWAIAGISNWASDEYQRQHRTELDWVRTSMRSLTLASGIEPIHSRDTAALLHLVAEDWVANRHRQHSEVKGKAEFWLDQQERVIFATLVFGLALSTIIAVGTWRDEAQAAEWRDDVVWWMVVLPAVTAIASTFAEKFATYEEVRRYEYMIPIYRKAFRRLHQQLNKNDFAGARVLLLELGREALQESGDWVVTNRDRELDPPEGG